MKKRLTLENGDILEFEDHTTSASNLTVDEDGVVRVDGVEITSEEAAQMLGEPVIDALSRND